MGNGTKDQKRNSNEHSRPPLRSTWATFPSTPQKSRSTSSSPNVERSNGSSWDSIRKPPRLVDSALPSITPEKMQRTASSGSTALVWMIASFVRIGMLASRRVVNLVEERVEGKSVMNSVRIMILDVEATEPFLPLLLKSVRLLPLVKMTMQSLP